MGMEKIYAWDYQCNRKEIVAIIMNLNIVCTSMLLPPIQRDMKFLKQNSLITKAI